MLIGFISFLAMIIPFVAHAEYIEAGAQDDVFVQVYGDGMEDGVDLQLSFIVRSDWPLNEPVLVVPVPDNASDCVVRDVTLLKQDLLMSYETRYYRIRIDTRVLADSGGCIVMAYHPLDGQTISILKYDYMTDGL